jgi:succinate dehydrogenase / fumarate reductase iron-sulfur subunit
MQTGDKITYHVRRFDPTKDGKPHWESYVLEYRDGMTVLDGLWEIKGSQAPDLAWRASCRMGVCGSCGMMINGSPALACNTQVKHLGGTRIAVAPLPNFDIIKDLVPDLTSMIDTHADLKPWVIREDTQEQENPTGEYWQSAEQLEEYLQFSYCIKCGCCMSACPTYATDPRYSGPMPLAAAHRYNADTRDDGFRERKQALAGDAGPWRCHYAGECSRVCPKGVDPAKAIQLMKREMVLDLLRLRRRPDGAGLAEHPNLERRPNIPDPPERTA